MIFFLHRIHHHQMNKLIAFFTLVTCFLQILIPLRVVGQSLLCDETRECDYASNTGTSISCYGYYSCQYSTTITITSGTSPIYCRGYYSCSNADYIINSNGDIHCGGRWSCYSVDYYISAGSGDVICEGYAGCQDSSIIGAATVECTGAFGCKNSDISYAEVIEVYGYGAAQSADISSTGVSGTTMTVYLYGYLAGSGTSLECADSYDTCYLYCQGNGCSGSSVSGSGTWIVSCDESQNIDCPNGYVGPTSSPTHRPSYLPTSEPTGGMNESVSCRDESQCQFQTLFGTSVDCSGYRGCYGSSSYTITSLSSYVLCDGEQSCYELGTISSASYVSCKGDSACYGATIIANSDIICGSLNSCANAVMTAGTESINNGAVYCYSSNSCAYATINNAYIIYGYGMNSLANSQIIKSDGGGITVELHGYETGMNSVINCTDSSTCYINCYTATSCTNVTVTASDDSTVIITCDESEGIACPNYINSNGISYVGPTDAPTLKPTAYPTIEPSNHPTNVPENHATYEIGVAQDTEGTQENKTALVDCDCNQGGSKLSGKNEDTMSFAALNDIDGMVLLLVLVLGMICLLLSMCLVFVCVKLRVTKKELEDLKFDNERKAISKANLLITPKGDDLDPIAGELHAKKKKNKSTMLTSLAIRTSNDNNDMYSNDGNNKNNTNENDNESVVNISLPQTSTKTGLPPPRRSRVSMGNNNNHSHRSNNEVNIKVTAADETEPETVVIAASSPAIERTTTPVGLLNNVAVQMAKVQSVSSVASASPTPEVDMNKDGVEEDGAGAGAGEREPSQSDSLYEGFDTTK